MNNLSHCARQFANRLIMVVGLSLLVFQTGAAAADKKAPAGKPIEPAKTSLGRPIDFEKDIYPILDDHCVACHNLAESKSRLSLEDVDGLLKGGKRGPAVVAKQPDKSLLYLVAARRQKPAMPPLPNKVEATALSSKELGLLRQWILEGATKGAGAAKKTVQWHALPGTLKAIYSVALSHSARFAAAGRANRISVYDISLGEEAARLVDPALAGVKSSGGRLMYPGGAAHRDFVHALAFNPDGTLLASGGYRVVKLWRRPQNVQSARYAGKAPVTAIAVSSDGQSAAIGAADNSITLVNPTTGKTIRSLRGHTGPITGLVFSPDGKTLFSGSRDKTIRLWTVASGAPAGQMTTPAVINAVTLNQKGDHVISAHADKLIRIWSVASASAKKPVKPVRELKGHSGSVTSLARAITQNRFVSGSEDGTVRLWDAGSGRLLRTFNHGGTVTAVAVRPDASLVASAGTNNQAKLWQANNGKQVAILRGEVSLTQRVTDVTDEGTVAGQRLSQATAALKAGEKELKTRTDAAKKAAEAKTKVDKALAEAKKKEAAAKTSLTAAQAALKKKPKDGGLKKKVTAAEKALAAATAVVKKADAAVKSANRSRTYADKAVVSAKNRLEQFKKDKAIAEAYQKQIASRLATVQKADKAADKPIRAIAFSSDGKRLVTAGDDRLVHLWNGTTGAALETFAGHGSTVSAVVFTADNQILSGAADKLSIVWNTRPGWKLIARLGAGKDAPLDVSQSPFVNRILALDFSPDGKLLGTAGGDPSRSGELMIWDVAKQTLIRNIKDAHSDTILGLDFSRDGRFIASAASDKFVKIFEVSTGRFVRSFEGHTHHVLAVSWQADGTTLASAGADNVIKIWNVATGEQRRTIGGYGKQVTSIQFIGVGGNIVSCGGDKTVRLHQTSNGRNYRNFSGATDFMYAAAANRDESLIVAGGEDGVLRVWNGKNGQSLFTFAPPKPPLGTNARASTAGPKK